MRDTCVFVMQFPVADLVSKQTSIGSAATATVSFSLAGMPSATQAPNTPSPRERTTTHAVHFNHHQIELLQLLHPLQCIC